MRLVYPNEKRLFVLLAIISTLVWVAVLVGTVGMVLIYALLFWVVYLFAQSAFIAHLKGNGVKITAAQFPDIHERLERACERLGVTPLPEAYLINSHGIVNALATRFLGRDFLVLYSDAIEALAERPNAVDFYIGHELGHIRRKHLRHAPLLLFGSLLPLIGAAYSRAREYTCDLHGLACCADTGDAQRALAVLAAGNHLWPRLDLDAYRAQLPPTGGFWMSFHELTADYPWLVKRLEYVAATAEQRAPERPRRSALAWVLAAFVPRLGGRAGGLAPLLIVVAMIGILAAIAIPAYQNYTARANVALALQQVEPLKQREYRYILEHRAFPATLDDIGAADFRSPQIAAIEVGDKGSLIVHLAGRVPALRDKTVVVSPYISDGRLHWRCTGGSVAKGPRPPACR